MASPSLERSVNTFRRSGSSGMVWEDRHLCKDFFMGQNKMAEMELRHSQSVGTIGQLDRRGSVHGSRPYRTTTRLCPIVDPPSPKPKLPTCGFFGLLGNSRTVVSGNGKGSSKPCRL